MFSGSQASSDFWQGLGECSHRKGGQKLSLDNNELNLHEAYILVKKTDNRRTSKYIEIIS